MHCFFPSRPKLPEYRQLDYILITDALAEKNKAEPKVSILRNGMAYRASDYTGPRFPGVGYDNPKASDHALLWVSVELV